MIWRGAVAMPIAVFLWLALAGVALAHGIAPEPSSGLEAVLAWTFDPEIILPLIGAALLYRWAAGLVRREHPDNPVPRYRVWSWYLGLLVIFFALESPIGTYDDTLFSVHMIQHLLLVMAAAPLLAIGAPITLVLRISSPKSRNGFWLPLLHSRVIRVLAFPVVSWSVFAAVMWASHFSPLFDAALSNDYIHLFEHALYLGSGLLFWWPVVGADPSPWRLPHPGRLAYLFLGMPQSSFLGLAIFSAPEPLYAGYLGRTWGPPPLIDQQLAGGFMWAGGDMCFLIALIVALWVWMRAEERAGRIADEKLDREEAARTASAGAPVAAEAAVERLA